MVKREQYYIILLDEMFGQQEVIAQPNFREAMKNFEQFKEFGRCPIVVKEVISCDGNTK